MQSDSEQIIQLLIEEGKKFLDNPYAPLKAAGDPDNPIHLKRFNLKAEQIQEANELISNLEEYPHAFVLACIMDTSVVYERAWQVPYRISQLIDIKRFEFEKLLELEKDTISEYFANKENNFGLRYHNDKAEYFYNAVQRIHDNYDDDASKIWENRPTSSKVIRNFLGFKGVGVKIATMAANILVREFKIQFQDMRCIDISPDIHVKQVLSRLGLISMDAKIEEINYFAREKHPEYPGIIDLPIFGIGRNWCKPKKPDCSNCSINELCPKISI